MLQNILLLLLTVFFLPVSAIAQYITPGTGINWSMDSLVTNAGSAVSGSNQSYRMLQSVTVAPGDTLNIGAGDTLRFADETGQLRLEINGVLLAQGTEQDSIIITSEIGQPGDYYGLEFRDTDSGSAFELRYASISFADRAIDVFGADAIVENCQILYSNTVAVDLTASGSTIRNCLIANSLRRTLEMTLSASPLIESNVFVNNNTENVSPYNFISIGLQGTNSPEIRGNHIIGGSDRSGGISIWNASFATIEDNIIQDCAFGILCFQTGANPLISNNTLMNNTANPDTVLYGFGIACNGNNSPVITANRISGHFYGVAIINGATPNVGDVFNGSNEDDGFNQFLGNGIGSNRYELFNNNALPIQAQNNWWGTDDPDSIEARIVHQVDDPAYGLVTFTPFIDMDPTAIPVSNQPAPDGFALHPAYPNPFNPSTTIRFEVPVATAVTLDIFDNIGRHVLGLRRAVTQPGTHEWQWNGTNDHGNAVGSGVYYFRLQAGIFSQTRKMILIR